MVDFKRVMNEAMIAFADRLSVVYERMMVLGTTRCKMLGTFIHSFLGTLSTRSNPVNLLVTSSVQS